VNFRFIDLSDKGEWGFLAGSQFKNVKEQACNVFKNTLNLECLKDKGLKPIKPACIDSTQPNYGSNPIKVRNAT